MSHKVSAYSASEEKASLKSTTIERRAVGAHDVGIDILYCGICHSDIHMVNNDWGGSLYPMVPGHEIVGRVREVGSEVTKFKPGDLAAIGCFVDSCRECGSCVESLQQYCENGMTLTYGSEDSKHGGVTYGGYSKEIVADENYVLHVPENLELAAVAPLLCAGITTYSPLRHWKVSKGDTVGVIGLGGLGHMAVKFAHALGAKVVMITTSPQKGDDARHLGADEVLISTDQNAMAKYANHFDFLLNTIPVTHDLNPYVNLLKRDATMVIVGVLTDFESNLNGGGLIFGRKSIAGSVIGGIKETQEMLDFCGKHNIVSEIELIKMADVNTAYKRLVKNNVKYRFVIDLETLA